MSDKDKVIKPPIGVIPTWRWIELRLEDIEGAIARYKKAGRPVPNGLLKEACKLTYKIGYRNLKKQNNGGTK